MKESPSLRLLIWLARRSRDGRPAAVLRLWPLWERLARRIWPTEPVPNAPYGTFDVYFGRYRGAPFTLPDGTEIRKGDPIAEVHLNNRVVVGTVRFSRWALARTMGEDLRALATWIGAPGFPRSVKAVYGVTVVGRAAVVLGFSLRERPVTLYARLDRFFMTGLLLLYDPKGLDRLLRGKVIGTYPQEIWMSRAELMRRYGTS